ncbi:MAG: response regulator [Nitrospirota bacterium]
MSKRKVVVIDDSPTVRKLAEVVLTEEGYKVYTAEDGEEGLKLAEEVLPSVILVDFIMPRMNGYQFCKMVRNNDVLKDVPVILITAKGEDVGVKFTEKFGVVDYFIKPFQPEELVEKVNTIIQNQREIVTVPDTFLEEKEREKEVTEPVYTADIGESVDRVIRRYFYKEFPSLLQKTIADILKQSGVVKTAAITLSGDLSDFSLFDVFQLIDNAKSSGKLSIYSPTLSSEIYFDKGSIVYAATSKQGRSFLSGDLIEKRKNIPKDVFKRVYRKSKESGMPILSAFVKEGVLTEDESMAILRDRIDDAIYSTMELESGHFFFEKMPLPENFSDIPIRLKASQLILEGARRVDERRFAAKMFQDNRIVFMRLMTDVALEDINLDENELRIFSLVDGKRTLGDIIKMSSIEEREAKRIFYTLTKVGILKKK